jgi:hypothetical protein
MAPRYGDWQLLGQGSDPVPGDSEEIHDASTRYRKVAADIASQVRRLRQIHDDDQILRGEYADGLRDACEDTAKDLDRAHDRFAEVGSALGDWWEPVETARTKTWSALKAAEAAQEAIDANPEPDPLPPGAPEPTSDDVTAEKARAKRHGDAVDALAQAKRDFEAAMEPYEAKAAKVAKAIRDAADDDMKDGGWDRFKNWIDDNAEWLTKVANIIGWVVTIVAVVALFITPAGWIIALVLAIAVVGLGIRVLLAASGNGSWFDVAIDLVGVLTLGTGRLAASIAKMGRSATLRAIGQHAGNLARTRAVTTARQAFANAGLFQKPGVWLRQSNPVARWLAGRSAFTSTKLSWLTRELPEVSRLEAIAHGMDGTAAAMSKELAMLRGSFPELVLPTYERAASALTGIARTGASVDVSSKALGGDPFWFDGFDFYNDFKGNFTYSPGGHLG